MMCCFDSLEGGCAVLRDGEMMRGVGGEGL